MLDSITKSLFGSKNERELKALWPIVSEVNAREADTKKLSDEELVGKTLEFRERLEKGEDLDSLLPEAFAVVREASVRVLGMRHFDVQLLGGIVLHQGRIAEMKTGEGKTLCATLPVYLNAISGKGVHLVTVNDYLAKRDAEWMGSVYRFLGLSTGVVVAGMSYEDRIAAYKADITYGQNNEFGFDYLRDNMKTDIEEKVQVRHNFAIVDEVDSILVDEARTPLIISGPSSNPTDTYKLADTVIRQLKNEVDYDVELKSKQVTLTEEGVANVEKILGIDNLYAPNHVETVHHINQAIKAHVTMKRDFDYVVRNGEVIIVDEFTGRLMPGRRWSDGLHQAVEAKEGVNIARESQTLATITFQNYFRMYDKLAGMTGTADTEAVEFQKIYGLDVVIVPTNKPMLRQDHPDVVFSTENGKYNAVCEEIEKSTSKGQPVLVGTASIARSEQISRLLQKRGVQHHVLNAKQHEKEADIVAQAGRLGAVTISTNMAGRGTDILLGGNPEFLAAEEVGTRDPEDPDFQEAVEHYKAQCEEEKQQVLDAGGLHIIGTERHESRRIDNQLRGRSGRQGDPGSSRFYVSLEDDLMRRFGGEKMQMLMSRFGMGEDDALEGTMVARAIENAQKKVEGYHFDVRKHLLEYDDVMNKQREVIYSLREKVLREEEMEESVHQMVPDIIEDIIMLRASEKAAVDTWDVEGMFTEVNRQFALGLEPEPWLEKLEDSGKELAQELFETFRDKAYQRYEERKAHFGADRMKKLERLVYLEAIDYFWKEHLSNMDHLKEGIGLRGYGQKNPLHEYQRESYELFTSMMFAIKSAVLQNVFVPELPSDEELKELEEREREMAKQRVEQAETIHEDVSAATAEPGEKVDRSGMNRKQRRREEKKEEKLHNFKATKEDYAPASAQIDEKSKARKNAQRRKNKAARKSRKRAR